ncbi:MAG: hypothetical protein JWM95_4962 [Gemmatimonadetes bacterium]|nr:hypothetical protein [Gemmatimonadota bacterium]
MSRSPSLDSVHMLAHRVRAWWRAASMPRLRRILFAIYLLTAALDAAGKSLAATPAFNRAAAELVSNAHAENLRNAARPSGNYEIFRLSSRNLVSGADLYAEYPEEHSDRFKYSPTFALLFSPLSWMPWQLGLFLWSALNALVLFVSIERVLPGRNGLLALAFLHLEVLRAMQNAQSNALVAGLIILAFAALERGKAWKAAGAVLLGASVKIFPLAALSFAIPRRLVMRTGVWATAMGATLLAAPLLVTTPARLVAQYRSWQGVESSDAKQRWFSVMELIHRWFGTEWPNWPVQLAGTLVLLAPLVLRRERWDEARFRLTYLASVLLFAVLFNHQAERASYVIAFTGATLWFCSAPRTTMRSVLYGIAFVTTPLMSTLIPGALFRTDTATLYRLAVPALAIWGMAQLELLRRTGQAGPRATEADGLSPP